MTGIPLYLIKSDVNGDPSVESSLTYFADKKLDKKYAYILISSLSHHKRCDKYTGACYVKEVLLKFHIFTSCDQNAISLNKDEMNSVQLK